MVTLPRNVKFRAKQLLASGTFLTTVVMDGEEAQGKVMMRVSFKLLTLKFFLNRQL